MTAPPESAPALPSTPDFPSRPASPEPEPKEPVKRFAKTLRLTSEQLVSTAVCVGDCVLTRARAEIAGVEAWREHDHVLVVCEWCRGVHGADICLGLYGLCRRVRH